MKEPSFLEKLDSLKGVRPRGVETKLIHDLTEAAPKLHELINVEFYAKSQIYDLFKTELDKAEITSKKFYSVLKKVLETYAKTLSTVSGDTKVGDAAVDNVFES